MWQKIINYLRESRAELSKVTWPKREEVIRLTGVVLAVSFLTAIYLGLLDEVLLKLTQVVIKSRK